jgi:hypothetical protein
LHGPVHWRWKDNVNRLANFNVSGVPLWEPKVNTPGIDLLDMEYLVANIIRDDQVAHVSTSVCDYARERRCDALEGDFLLQNPEVFLKGMLIRLHGLGRQPRRGQFL